MDVSMQAVADVHELTEISFLMQMLSVAADSSVIDHTLN